MTFRFSASFVPLIFRRATPHACLRADVDVAQADHDESLRYGGQGGQCAEFAAGAQCDDGVQ